MTDTFAFDFAPDAEVVRRSSETFSMLAALDLPTRVATLNALRLELHKHSPFASEPVDCVQWVLADLVQANNYNPNSVAPPEMNV